jgi:hypothetical protein
MRQLKHITWASNNVVRFEEVRWIVKKQVTILFDYFLYTNNKGNSPKGFNNIFWVIGF